MHFFHLVIKNLIWKIDRKLTKNSKGLSIQHLEIIGCFKSFFLTILLVGLNTIIH